MSHTNLSAAEIALLDSQLPDIGGAIRGKPVTPDGDGWRVGSSTKISKNGRWFDFKAQQGGFGAASFIAHYRACTPEEAVAWAQSWLAQHPQRGPCGGADEDDGAGEDSADTLQRRAYIESTYAARLPIAGTPAAAYLVGRGIDPAQLRPDIVERMGWLPNHRGAEGALVFPYTDEAGGVQGLHFIFVTPTGEKSPHEPARQTRRGPPDWRTKGRALLRLDFGTGPEMVVAEGFENALAISLTGADRVVAVGAVGAYGRCPLPRTVETITIAHDGDDPDAKAAAAQAYHRGVVRYLGQGLMLRMTAPPTGCDPNDVLKRDGPDALKKLLTEARCDLGKFDNAAFLDEVCRLDDLAYDRARVTALKLLGLSKLDTLDKERKATRKRWAETPGSTEVPPVPDDDQPWLEPVTDIGPVLDTALTELARYVIAPLHRLATAVLWSAYAHLLPRADLGIDVAPRLAIRSKVRGSGKSTLLECVENLTPNPVLAGSITPSSVFRIIDATRATLLIDEADNIVNKNSSPDLLAILNSGHRRRTAYVIRSVPTPDGGWVPAKFNTFTGIAFAGLEILPETLQDRSLGLPLHKATREEKPEHLANGYSPVLIECRRKFARWAADLTELPAVTLPPELFNRTGDNWRGLFSIAEAAGGRMAGTRQAGGDGGDQRGGQQPRPAAAGSHLADLRREEGRAHAHDGPAAGADENRGGAMGGGEQRPRDRCATGCGKSSRASCRGPQIPKRRRRSAVPANGGRGKALPAKATRRTICAKPGGATSIERPRPRQPKAAAAGARTAAGHPLQTSRSRPKPTAGFAAEGADGNGGKRTPKGKGAHNGHGPAKRRTRPSEAEPVGEA